MYHETSPIEKITQELLGFLISGKKLASNHMKMVSENPSNIKNIPKRHYTPDLCMAAVSGRPSLLSSLDDKFLTPEIIIAAVKMDPGVILHIRNDLKTPDVCVAAIESAKPGFVSFILNSLKPHHLTDDVIATAFIKNSDSVSFLSESIMTENVYEKASLKDGSSIKNMPDHALTKKVLENSLSQDGYNISYFKKSLRTHEMCILAVKNSDQAIYDLTENEKTEDVRLASIEANGMSNHHLSYREN